MEPERLKIAPTNAKARRLQQVPGLCLIEGKKSCARRNTICSLALRGRPARCACSPITARSSSSCAAIRSASNRGAPRLSWRAMSASSAAFVPAAESAAPADRVHRHTPCCRTGNGPSHHVIRAAIPACSACLLACASMSYRYVLGNELPAGTQAAQQQQFAARADSHQQNACLLPKPSH